MMQCARRFILIPCLAGLATACSDPPTSPPASLPGFDAVVSDPFTYRLSSSAGRAGVAPAFSGARVDGVAFVSLPPGTVPDAETATVVNLRTQQTIVPTVVDGGFDPIEIRAEAGDTIVTTMVSSSGAAAFARSVVPARRRPRVVRTSPARGRTDVAINSHITAVFSEPIDPGSLSAASMTLLRGADTVAGTLRLMPGSDLVAELVPAGPLAPATQHTLVLSDLIRDLSGDPLEADVPTVFTTSAEELPEEPLPAGARLEFSTEPASLAAFTPFAPAIVVTARDAEGAIVTGFSGQVTIRLGSASSTAGLMGVASVRASAGVAVFADLAVNEPGDGFVLIASAEPGIEIVSNAFAVTDNSWSLRSSSPLRYFAASAVLNGSLYILGGTTDFENLLGGSDRVDAYDPVTNTWAQKAPLPTPLARAGAGVVNGILYVAGGRDEGGASSKLFAYDPSTDSWSERAEMPDRRMDVAVGVVNGILYVLGGYSLAEGTHVGRLTAYDPTTDSWSVKASMPTARGELGALVVDGALYAIGGITASGMMMLDDVETYDPAADRWTIRAPIPTARSSMGIAARNGHIYVIGGFANPMHRVGDVEVYDPDMNRWAPGPAMPIPRGGRTQAGVIDNVIYAMDDGGGLYQLVP